MIKNERQYRITTAQANRFEEALAQFRARASADSKTPPLLLQAQEAAMQSQLDDLRAQLAEYDALRSGKRKTLPLESLEDLPRTLIQARIASGLSQKELAERLGLKEQQIQRYEATEYASASLERLCATLEALEVRIGGMRLSPAKPARPHKTY